MSIFSLPFRKSKVERLFEKSRADYENACKKKTFSSTLSFRIKLAKRAKANIDKSFIEAATQIEKYENLKEIYYEAELSVSDLAAPVWKTPYQLIKSDSGVIVSFIPDDYSKEVFSLARAYQICQISAGKATLIANNIISNICSELNVNMPINVLEFVASSEDENKSIETPGKGLGHEALSTIKEN